MRPADVVLLVLRVAMETAIVVALAWWGLTTGGSTATSLLLGLGAPLVGFGFWGAVDFHQLGPLAEPTRLVQELLISLLAALALAVVGLTAWAWALMALTLGYHALVYVLGRRLLPAEPATR